MTRRKKQGRKKSTSRSTLAKSRPRGADGRFLTKEQIAALDAEGVSSEVTETLVVSESVRSGPATQADRPVRARRGRESVTATPSDHEPAERLYVRREDMSVHQLSPLERAQRRNERRLSR